MPTVITAASSTTCVSYIAEMVPTSTASQPVNSRSTMMFVGWLRRADSEQDSTSTRANEAANGVQNVHGFDHTNVFTGVERQKTAVTAAVMASCSVKRPAQEQ